MLSNNLSLFGATGFVLGEYYKKYGGLIENRDTLTATYPDILYGISTVTNYNVYDDPQIDIQTNLLHLMKVLSNSYLRFGRDLQFNFISSWFVYGACNDSPVKETHTCNPNGMYSITKYTAERLLASYAETMGFSYKIIRLANVMGVQDKRVSLTKNALQFIIGELVRGNPVEIYSEPSMRDYIWIDDCISAINLGIESEVSTLNIGNGVPINVKQVIYDVANRLGRVELIKEKPSPKFHKQVQGKDFWMDIGLLKTLGYETTVPIESMENRLIEHYG